MSLISWTKKKSVVYWIFTNAKKRLKIWYKHFLFFPDRTSVNSNLPVVFFSFVLSIFHYWMVVLSELVIILIAFGPNKGSNVMQRQIVNDYYSNWATHILLNVQWTAASGWKLEGMKKKENIDKSLPLKLKCYLMSVAPHFLKIFCGFWWWDKRHIFIYHFIRCFALSWMKCANSLLFPAKRKLIIDWNQD